MELRNVQLVSIIKYYCFGVCRHIYSAAAGVVVVVVVFVKKASGMMYLFSMNVVFCSLAFSKRQKEPCFLILYGNRLL